MAWFRKRDQSSEVTVEDLRALEAELKHWKKEVIGLKRLVAAHESKIRQLSTRRTP